MSSAPRQTVIIPLHLGPASNYDPEIFPLTSFKGRDKIGKGGYFLEATLDELAKIASMGANPSQCEGIVATVKARIDQLHLEMQELRELPKTRNPLKFWANFREVKLFLAASEGLYRTTRRRSEEIRRAVRNQRLLSFPYADVQPVLDNVPQDAAISGISISLDHPLDEATTQTIEDAANAVISYADPFVDDPSITQLSSVADSAYDDWDASSSMSGATASDISAANSAGTTSQAFSPRSPSSGASVNHYYFFRDSVVVAPNSNVHGATVIHGGSQNSGSVNNQIQITPETPPSASS